MTYPWNKKGLIYSPSGLNGFDVSHCHKPTPLLLKDGKTIRVYFGVRDSEGKTRTTFIDVKRDNPSEVMYVHDKPVLDLGKIGAFDDSGVNVCSVVRDGSRVLMYFIGWNPSTTVHTRNSIGVAVSEDDGMTFRRLYDGSILDRTKDEPYYTGAVDVMRTSDDDWRIWYTSGSEWKIVNGKPEIWYHIKYGHSNNGIDWERDGSLSIPPQDEFEATARPSVLFDGEIYRMWYSRRSIVDFRVNSTAQYRAGYAESSDGIEWTRMDDKVGITTSETGWDSEAIAYPYVIDTGEKLVMFYNGNGFGKTGFGYAECNK